jgi:hypothetical protein
VVTVSGGVIFGALFMSLTLLLVGVSCLLWPQTIQAYALKQNPRWTRRNPFQEWIKTPQYVTYLRLMGGAVTAIAGFLTIVFMKKWFETWFI